MEPSTICKEARKNDMFVDVFDQELPMLASDAAVELDLLLNGVQVDTESVHLLAQKLASVLMESTVGSTSQSLQTDTALQNVLGFAFAKTGDDPKTILQNLFTRTTETVTNLAKAGKKEELSELEWQRAFCLALSQAAASHQQMLFDLQPVHPDRR